MPVSIANHQFHGAVYCVHNCCTMTEQTGWVVPGMVSRSYAKLVDGCRPTQRQKFQQPPAVGMVRRRHLCAGMDHCCWNMTSPPVLAPGCR